MRATLVTALLCFLGPLAGIVAFNAHVDPYQYYHRHTGERPMYSTNARWQNPGLLRTHSYDTAVIGTSRSQNFQADMFRGGGWRVVNVAAAGATAEEQRVTLALALDQPQTQRAVVELSSNSFVLRPRVQQHTFPDFLYEPSPETPFLYLVSLDLFWQSLAVARGVAPREPLDTLNVWGLDATHRYGRDAVLASISCSGAGAGERTPADVEASVRALFATLDTRPDVEFVLFFPPVAGIALHLAGERAVAQRAMLRRQLVAGSLARGNVRLYDFAVADVVLNLNRFKDVGHYDLEVNRWMAGELLDPRSPHRVVSAAAADALEHLRARVDVAGVTVCGRELG